MTYGVYLFEEGLVKPSLVVVEVVLVRLHHQVEQNQAHDHDRQHLSCRHWVGGGRESQLGARRLVAFSINARRAD